MTDHPAIEATGLGKSYGAARVLGGIDLAITPGCVFALLGPNGAGKTTAVRIFATLTQPDQGSARVAGFDVVSERHEVRRRISLTGQDVALDDLQSGGENLAMIARLQGLPRGSAQGRARELLGRFDLLDAADRRVSTYSGGMRRRLDLAAGLIVLPEVLFLDEPTTGLDPRSRQAVWGVVEELAASGVTVLLTTQYLDEADRLAQQVAVIDGGRIVAQGSPAELKRHAGGSRLEVQLTGREGFDVAASHLGARMLHGDLSTLTLEVATSGQAVEVRALLDEIDPGRSQVATFALRSASLDDVFMTLTGHATTAPESETTYV